MRFHLLPTASDLAILAGALWETRPARAARAAACVLPALGIILALAVATEIDDRLRREATAS
jgi:hypothetical protein